MILDGARSLLVAASARFAVPIAALRLAPCGVAFAGRLGFVPVQFDGNEFGFLLGEFDHLFVILQVVGRDDHEGLAGAPGAAGAADAVDIVVGEMVRNVEIEHVADIGDVEAAGGDVGGDQQLEVSLAEGSPGSSSACSGPGRRGSAAASMAVGTFSDLATTSTSVLRLQKTNALFLIVASGRSGRAAPCAWPWDRSTGILAHQVLGDVLAGGGGARGTSMRTGSLRNCLVSRVISGGMVAEKNRVCFFGGVSLEDALDIGDEAHVQHAVGFIDHHDLDAGHQKACRARNGRAGGRAWRSAHRRRGPAS